MRIVWYRQLNKFPKVHSANSNRGVAITLLNESGYQQCSWLWASYLSHLLLIVCGYCKTLDITVAILTVSSLSSCCDKIPWQMKRKVERADWTTIPDYNPWSIIVYKLSWATCLGKQAACSLKEATIWGLCSLSLCEERKLDSLSGCKTSHSCVFRIWKGGGWLAGRQRLRYGSWVKWLDLPKGGRKEPTPQSCSSNPHVHMLACTPMYSPYAHHNKGNGDDDNDDDDA